VSEGWLGFDVGGQSIKGVLLGDDGRILAEGKRATGLSTDAQRLIAAIADLGAELSGKAPPGAAVAGTIGIGIAGVMASDGVLAGSPNLPKLVGTTVKRALSDGLGRDVAIDNDANCAALAEGWRGGAAEGCRDFLLITLGSGIGSGLVIGGELYHGATGYACELGHTIVVAGGRRCGCGNLGCFEAYVSESAVRSLAHEGGSDTGKKIEKLVNDERVGHAEALFRLAGEHDAGAAAMVADMMRMLGIGLASAVNLLDVPTIVIGGGIGPAVLQREREIRAAMATALFARPESAITLLRARRGSDAGAVGAARLAMIQAGGSL
jgi:glucokinase